MLDLLRCLSVYPIQKTSAFSIIGVMIIIYYRKQQRGVASELLLNL